MGETPGGTLPLEKEGFPLDPSEGNHFRPHPPPDGSVGCGLAAFKEKRIRPGAPSARRDRKPEAAFLGESARGGLLSEERIPLPQDPLPKKAALPRPPLKGRGGRRALFCCFPHNFLERAGWRVQKRRCRRHCLLPGVWGGAPTFPLPHSRSQPLSCIASPLNAPHGAFKSGGAGGTASCPGLGAEPQRSLVPFVLLVPYRLSSLSRVWIAFFSMRETYEREMPSFSATSYWGRHSPSSRP